MRFLCLAHTWINCWRLDVESFCHGISLGDAIAHTTQVAEHWVFLKFAAVLEIIKEVGFGWFYFFYNQKWNQKLIVKVTSPNYWLCNWVKPFMCFSRNPTDLFSPDKINCFWHLVILLGEKFSPIFQKNENNICH